MNIFVGNLNFSTTEDAIRALFEEHGEVSSVKIPTDRETGRPRGFAFVEMPDANEAKTAMEALNGKEIEGRALNVNEARPKPERRPGGGGGSGGGSGGGNRPPRRDRW
jgi:RNA recognition motif-containing protein